jgi:hypothetical protein
MSVDSGEEPHSYRYISVPKAVQLIPKSFNGNPLELREFIQNVESAYEVVDPLDYSLLLKFVQAKIGGEAKTELLARNNLHTWEQVRAVLDENYSVRRTLDYYAHRAFTSKQNPVETISQWGARMDTVCGDLQRAARKHMEDLELNNEKREGGGDIIDLIVRACFTQGLHDDRIKTMVKAKGNVNTRMAQLVEVALEEECAIRSERFKRGHWEKGQQKNYGTRHAPQRHLERKEVRVATVTCYRCQKMGHISRDCKEASRIGKDEQVTGRQERKGPSYRNKSGNERRAVYPSNRRQASPQYVANMNIRGQWLKDDQVNETGFPADRDCRMHEVNCCCTPHKGLTNRQKGYPNSQTLLSLNIDDKSKRPQNKCPFVIYTLCSELKNNMGNALIDTGSQISLVAEDSLKRGLKFEPQTIQIYGITGSVMKTKGQIDLSIG